MIPSQINVRKVVLVGALLNLCEMSVYIAFVLKMGNIQ